MKLKAILLLFIISFCSLYSYSDETKSIHTLKENKQIISKIYIKGLKNKNLIHHIVAVLRSKENDCYSVDTIRKDINSIIHLGHFDNVNFDYNNNGELILTVSEKPCIEQITFNGNTAFSIKKLNKAINLKQYHYYTKEMIDKAKQHLLKLYINAGYHNCTIDYQIIINEVTNKTTVIFNITENNKIIVKDIEITGLLLLNKQTIMKQLKTKLGSHFNNKIYIKDLERINDFCKQHGFIDYKLIESNLVYNNKKTEVLIRLNINEGPHYKIGNVSFYGNIALNNKTLYKTSSLHYNDIMNQNKVEDVIPKKIYEIYCDKGYINATIQPLLDKQIKQKIVNINYLITENEIVYIGNVYICQNNVNKAKILRRAIILNSGDILIKKKLQKSISNLYNLGFISNVNYTLLKTDLPNVFDIVFSIVEHKPRQINVVAGYSFIQRIMYGIDFHHMNILNLGYHFSLLNLFSHRGYNYDTTCEIPWVLNRNINLSINLFRIRTKRNHLTLAVPNGYIENKHGFIIGGSSQLSDYINTFLGYKFEKIKPSSINDKDLEIISSIQHQLLNIYVIPMKITSILTRLVYDTRDFIYDPSTGKFMSFTIQLANDHLGGHVNFVKEILQSTWYYTTFKNCITSLNIECGAINGYGQNREFPLSEKFPLGGLHNVKGYGYDSTITGKYKYIMNIEHTFPIVLRNNINIIQGILFFDTGGIWNKLQDIRFTIGNNKYQLHSSVGIGLKFTSILFPIKIYLAYGLNSDKFAQKQYIYFDIGRFRF
ncbi:MAG: outer membrane protein assembly factor BamA [Endomicrobium sp.]|jgi:outer membrane protein insertion porin family|nr:outer membrane protein assembly factor BamA [Endomicrobium sp.]